MVDQVGKGMGRRAVLGYLGLGAGAAMAAPAVAQGRLSLQVTVGSSDPHMAAMAERAAQWAGKLSGGTLELRVEVTEAGVSGPQSLGDKAALVRLGDWTDTDPAFGLFSACPFGLMPREFEAWVLQENGAWMWEALGEAHGIKCLGVGDTGMRPGAWAKAEISAATDLRGRSVAAGGLGARVYQSLGADIRRPGARADLAESQGLALDLAAGMHKAYPHLYTAAMMQPQSAVSLVLPLSLWKGLGLVQQAALEAASLAAADEAMAESVAGEAASFAALGEAGANQHPIDQPLFDAIAQQSYEVLEEDMIARSAFSDAWFEYRYFVAEVTGWTAIGEGAFARARARALGVDT